jgi:hypothetical protein
MSVVRFFSSFRLFSLCFGLLLQDFGLVGVSLVGPIEEKRPIVDILNRTDHSS